MFTRLYVKSSSHMGDGLRLVNMANVSHIRQEGEGSHLLFSDGAWAIVYDDFVEIAGLLGVPDSPQYARPDEEVPE